MIAEKKLETLEHSSTRLTVTVDGETARKEYDELLQKYCKTAQIKGFRRGKVPPQILEQKFGDSLRGEASANLIENSLKEVFEEIEKKPLQFEPPELENGSDLELGKDFTFTVKYDVYPEIDLGKYKDIDIEGPTTSITAEDMNRELENLRDQNSIVLDKESGEVAKDDIVTIDYVEMDENEQEKPDSQRQDFVFTVGTGYNRFEIDEELIGMKNGVEKLIDKSFPEDHQDTELAGNSFKIKVKVTAVKEKQLPDLDDELAQDVSEEYENLEDLKKDLRKRLRAAADNEIRRRNIQSISEKIVEDTKFEAPESMVRAELASTWQRFLERSRIEENQMLQVLEGQGRSRDDLFTEWQPGAEMRIRSQLVMGEILDKEKLEVSDEELDEEIKHQAEHSDLTEEQARENLEKSNLLDYLRNEVRNRKLHEFLISNSNIKKGKKVRFLDLMGNNQ